MSYKPVWSIELPTPERKVALVRLTDPHGMVLATIWCHLWPQIVAMKFRDKRTEWEHVKRAIEHVDAALGLGRLDRTWEPQALWLEHDEEPRVWHLTDMKDRLLAIAWVPNENEERTVYMNYHGSHGSARDFATARQDLAVILGLDPNRVQFESPSAGFNGGRFSHCPECGRFADDERGHQPTCSRKTYSEKVWQALNGQGDE